MQTVQLNDTANKYFASDEREEYLIYAYGGNDTIGGNDGNDTIYGGDGKDVIKGEGGDDVIVGGKDGDTLTGGDGEDIFVYASGDGNDVITDYKEEDKIRFTSGTVDVSLKGNDVIFKVGSGSVTVKDAKDKVVTYIDKNGVERTFPKTTEWNAKGTKVTLLENFTKDTFDLAEQGDYNDTAKTIDGSATDNNFSITGNKLANKIVGGKGNNTLDGGKGNDTLTGGDGADTFVFSSTDGKDVIADYSEEDVIKFTSGVAKVSTVKGSNDVIFTFSKNNTVTVKNGKNRVITYIDSEGEHTYPKETLSFNKTKNPTSVSLLSAYVSEQFDVNTNVQVDDYVGSLKTINAAAVDHDIEIIGNAKANVIIGGSENNTINGGKGNDTLTGGNDADVFVFTSTDGKDVITNYQEKDKIQITSGDLNNVSLKGNDVIFTFNKSNTITVKDAKGKFVTYVDKDGVEHTYPEIPVTWNSGRTSATLLPNYSGSAFSFSYQGDYSRTIKNLDASAVDSDLAIIGNGKANKIIGGDGNDYIYGGAGNDTLTGGNGTDTFSFYGGDGNDVITDYEEEDVINIASGTVKSIKKSGKNVIITVGSNKISVMGAAEKYITYVDKYGVTNYYPEQPKPPVEIKGKTITLTERYSKSTFDVADYDSNITTIDASAVTNDLEIIGNNKANRITGSEEDDLINGGAGKDTIIGGDGNDTLIGGKGNDSLKGGNGADLFLFNSGDENDVIVDYDEEDIIKFTSGKATAKTVGNNVVFTVGNNKVTVMGGKEHVITYVDKEGTKIYPENPLVLNAAGTATTLKSNYRATSFDATANAYVADYADILKTIDGSQVTHDIEISGNGNANNIIGSTHNDTLIGGTGNDTLKGGKGQDVFVYYNGDGKDVIADYTEGEDVINVAYGKIKGIKNSGNNVVFTVGDGSITVKDGRNKTITYVDADGKEQVWPTPWTVKGETVTLTEKYYASKFDINDYDELSSIRNIDAGAISNNLSITGSAKANVIIGGAGKNTINGGAGNDTLTGGAGADVFVYNEGDGKDVIVDYGTSDMISIASGQLSGDVRVNGDTVIFTVSDGKISLDGAAGKKITIWYDGEKTSKIYTASSNDEANDDMFFYNDDTDFGGDNQLSSIVKSKDTDYSIVQSDYSASFTPKNTSLPIVTTSNKK